MGAESARLEVSADERATRIELEDGELVVAGEIHELIVSFTPDMSDVRPLSSLGRGTTAREAISLLLRGNGAFVAVVAERSEDGRGIRSVSLITDRLPYRTLYYGAEGGRRVVSTSPYRVSDGLGLGRQANREALVEICMHRNLVGTDTAFRGVSRMHNHEWVRLREGALDVERVDLEDYVMREIPFGEAGDPCCIDLARESFARGIRLRLEAHPQEQVTMLASAGLDSRVVLRICRELGFDNLTAISIGSRSGFDEGAIAREFAGSLGYECHAFAEEDLDLRGHLEGYVEACGYPPKEYNHLMLTAALESSGIRNGRLWTGDLTFGHARTIYSEAVRARRMFPWLPQGVARIGLPASRWLPGRWAFAMWLLSLGERGALAVAVASERTLEGARRMVEFFGGQGGPFDPAPHCGVQAYDAADRLIPRDHRAWAWAWDDNVLATSIRSRGRLAASIGAVLEYPLKDPWLDACATAVHRALPAGRGFSIWLKHEMYERWLARSEWHKKKGLVGGIARWFDDPTKLGDYRDLLASRECRERGLWEPREVGRLLDRSSRLTHVEACLLWAVLTTEILFRRGALRLD